jgi:iron complex outermembrane receptor protein
LTGRAIHFGDAYADAANRLLVPAWTRFDLGARYTFASPWNGKPITVRFTVENVLDNSYWMTSAAEKQIYLGAPRTYLASTTFRF